MSVVIVIFALATVLFAALLAPTSAEAATCTSASSPGGTFTDVSSTFTGCTITGWADFDFGSVVNTSVALSLLVSGSTVQLGQRLSIAGFAGLTAHQPLNATIVDSTFSNSALRIAGTFPSGTTITVLRTAFTLLDVKLAVGQNTGGGSGYLNPNLFFSSVVLRDGSLFRVAHSTISNVKNAASTYNMATISATVSSDLILSNHSSVVFSDTAISARSQGADPMTYHSLILYMFLQLEGTGNMVKLLRCNLTGHSDSGDIGSFVVASPAPTAAAASVGPPVIASGTGWTSGLAEIPTFNLYPPPTPLSTRSVLKAAGITATSAFIVSGCRFHHSGAYNGYGTRFGFSPGTLAIFEYSYAYGSRGTVRPGQTQHLISIEQPQNVSLLMRGNTFNATANLMRQAISVSGTVWQSFNLVLYQNRVLLNNDGFLLLGTPTLPSGVTTTTIAVHMIENVVSGSAGARLLLQGYAGPHETVYGCRNFYYGSTLVFRSQYVSGTGVTDVPAGPALRYGCGTETAALLETSTASASNINLTITETAADTNTPMVSLSESNYNTAAHTATAMPKMSPSAIPRTATRSRPLMSTTSTLTWPPRARGASSSNTGPSATTAHTTNTTITRSPAASAWRTADHARTASRTPTLLAPCSGVCVLRAVGTEPEDAARVEHANATHAVAWMLPSVAGGANATSFGSPSDANCAAAKIVLPFAVHRDGWVVVALVVTSEHLRPAPLSVAASSANPSWAVVETRMAVEPRVVLVSLERMEPAVLWTEEVIVTVKGAVTCPSGAVGPAVALGLAFAGAPNPLPQMVETLRDVAGAVASVGAVANPWGLVVAGTVTSVLAMGRCEAPEPTDDVDFLQSPLGLSAGPVEGGPYRGALAGIPLVVIAAKVVVCAVVFARGWLADKNGTWRGRARAGALAARAEAAVGMAAGAAFVNNVCAYCGIVLVTIAPDGSSDILLGTVSLLAAAVAVGHVWFVLWRCPLAERMSTVRELRTASYSRLRAAAAWLVTPQTTWGPTGADKSDTGGVGSGAMHDWEHRYGDYLGEARRWRQFLTGQMAVDGITSLLEGLPLHDRDHCKVRLSAVLVILLVAAVAITALRPLSIPLELGCAVVGQWLLVAVTAVMLANEWAANLAAESASQSIGVAAMVVNILPLLCIVVPQAVRALLELRRNTRRGGIDTDTPLEIPMLGKSDGDDVSNPSITGRKTRNVNGANKFEGDVVVEAAAFLAQLRDDIQAMATIAEQHKNKKVRAAKATSILQLE